jgi:hypothetical protein
MTLIIQKPTGAKLVLRKGWQPMDADAAAYITAVETADGQALEELTKIAIDNFVLGCKEDGIWSAIKASCILAGARTLDGALIPLAGTAPTNTNFVSGDYNRKTGLVGDGSTKELKTGVLGASLPTDDFSLSIYVSVAGPSGRAQIDAGRSAIGSSNIFSGGGSCTFRNRNSSPTTISSDPLGFVGSSRSTSSGYDYRLNKATSFSSTASQTPSNTEFTVFNFTAPTYSYSNARLAFYSIGEALDLAKLDARITDLITAFGVAIP